MLLVTRCHFLPPVLSCPGIPAHLHTAACVVFDKIDKMPKEKVVESLQTLAPSLSQSDAERFLALCKVLCPPLLVPPLPLMCP
jgi:hypothetical protein